MCWRIAPLSKNEAEQSISSHLSFFAPWALRWWLAKLILFENSSRHPGSAQENFIPFNWWQLVTGFPFLLLVCLPIPCFTHMCFRKVGVAKNEAEQFRSLHFSFFAPCALRWWSARRFLFEYSSRQPGSAQENLTPFNGTLLVNGFNFTLLTWVAGCSSSHSKLAFTWQTCETKVRGVSFWRFSFKLYLVNIALL